MIWSDFFKLQTLILGSGNSNQFTFLDLLCSLFFCMKNWGFWFFFNDLIVWILNLLMYREFWGWLVCLFVFFWCFEQDQIKLYVDCLGVQLILLRNCFRLLFLLFLVVFALFGSHFALPFGCVKCPVFVFWLWVGLSMPFVLCLCLFGLVVGFLCLLSA